MTYKEKSISIKNRIALLLYISDDQAHVVVLEAVLEEQVEMVYEAAQVVGHVQFLAVEDDVQVGALLRWSASVVDSINDRI